MESKLFKEPMTTGRRCVVVCDGFYEWQTTKKDKNRQPYFVFSPQKEGIKIDASNTWGTSWSGENGWTGPKLLQMAALYNTWKSPEV